MKRVLAASVSVLVLAGLTGCGYFRNPTDPYIAFRSVDGQLEITVCRALNVGEVILEERFDGGAWERLWDVPVEIPLLPGETITADQLPAESPLQQPRMAAGDELVVIVNSSDSSDLGTHADVFVPEGGMPAEKWLMSDGTVRDAPCARADDLRKQRQ